MEKLQKKIGYSFTDPEKLRVALTHKSMGYPNNERMEYFGDLILGLGVGHMLYTFKPELTPAEMTQIASNIVNGKALLEVAKDLGLSGYIKIEKVDDPYFSFDSVLSDAVEALVAAVFLDSGDYMVASRVVIDRMERFDLRRDNKTVLQERIQALGHKYPSYSTRMLDKDFFSSTVSSDGLGMSAKGYGKTRKEAEKEAAGLLMKQMDGKRI